MITSNSNAQVRYLVQLRKNNRFRRQEGAFLVEGPKMYREIPAAKRRKTYVSESYADQMPEEIRALVEQGNYEILKDSVMEYVSDTKTPQGILAVVSMDQYQLEDLLKGTPLLLLLENLQDPGNLGTIFRSGEGAGVTGIFMTKETADVYNPKVVRSTMGAVFRVPFLYVEDLRETMAQLQKHGIRLYAAHLSESVSYDQADFTKPSGFLIGNESAGLTAETTAAADGRIHIPMLGSVESLNAAAAASIVAFEAARQRRNQKK